MDLITVLIVLALERLIHLDSYLLRFKWFSLYAHLVQQTFTKTGYHQGIIGVGLYLLPIWLVVIISYWILSGWFLGFMGWILATLILAYCLGPRDLHTLYENYFVAEAKNDTQAKQQAFAAITRHVAEDSPHEKRRLTQATFYRAVNMYFAPLFWFVVLGPLMVVFYRLLTLIAHSDLSEQDNPGVAQSAEWLVGYLNWIPLRLLGLAFTLMGDFQQGFSYWWKHVLSLPEENQLFIEQCGLISLNLFEDSAAKADVVESKLALILLDRVWVLALVILALLTLGHLVH